VPTLTRRLRMDTLTRRFKMDIVIGEQYEAVHGTASEAGGPLERYTVDLDR